MRHRLFLTFTATSVFASPFRSGATWEWALEELNCRIVNGQMSYACSYDAPTMLSAQVLDSTLTTDGSTVQWKIRFVDSASAYETRLLVDTAILEEYPSRDRAKWIRGTVLFPIEPRAYDSLDELSAPLDPLYAWGLGWRAGISDSSGELTWDAHNLEMSDARMNNARGIGLLRWDSRLGWVGGQTGGIHWYVVRKDGEAFSEEDASDPWRVGIPRKGTVFLWEKRRDSSYYDPASALPNATSNRSIDTFFMETVRWTFLESLSDSSSWMRSTVEEVHRMKGKDSIAVLSLRWNRHTGQSFPKPRNEFCKDLVSGFWGHEYARDVGGFREDSDSMSVREIYAHAMKDFSRVRRTGGVDSSSCWHGFQGHMGWYGTGTDLTTYRLLQVNDSVIRQPSPVGVRARTPSTFAHGDLRALARQFPALQVTVRDARGAMQKFRLDDLGKRGGTQRIGLRWWQVRLPDGSFHRGSTIE